MNRGENSPTKWKNPSSNWTGPSLTCLVLLSKVTNNHSRRDNGIRRMRFWFDNEEERRSLQWRWESGTTRNISSDSNRKPYRLAVLARFIWFLLQNWDLKWQFSFFLPCLNWVSKWLHEWWKNLPEIWQLTCN